MNETTPQTDGSENDDDLRRKLVGRIAVAGVLIAALLGGLAVFDRAYVPPPTPAAKAEPPPAATPAPTLATEEKKDEAKEEAANEEGKETKETAQAEPESSESPSAPTVAKEEKPLKPLTKPAAAHLANLKPHAESPVAASRPEPGKEVARATAPTIARHAPASRPLTQAIETAKQYVLQLGVFNNLSNAEDLKAKLELNHIPAQIEARVQVGPFKTRQEAEEARTKLAALGLEPGILVAQKK